MRDTYIIRLWAVTGDIHLVSRIVGHSDIKQTIEYARFTPHELLVHFPSLNEYLKPRLKMANSLMDATEIDATYKNILEVTDGGRTS